MADEHGMGRIAAPDARDAAHLMAAHLPPPELATLATPTYRYWQPGPNLDQGQTSECVAFSFEGWLNASPTRTLDGPTPQAIYDRAQQLDEWHDHPHDGTSVRAGAKVMAEQGRIGEYVWGQTLDDVVHWLLLKGPVVIGIPWYEAMFDPDRHGFVTPGGAVAGGHALLVTGANRLARVVRVRNSWGPDWGINGNCLMRFDVLDRLLFQEGGECVGAVELRP